VGGSEVDLLGNSNQADLAGPKSFEKGNLLGSIPT